MRHTPLLQWGHLPPRLTPSTGAARFDPHEALCSILDPVANLHRHLGLGSSLRQLALMLAGIGTIALFHLGG